MQWHLNVRRELLAARTRLISVVRAITRSQGYRIAGGATDTFLTRLAALDLPVSVSESLVPVRSVMELLNHELADADRRFAARRRGSDRQAPDHLSERWAHYGDGLRRGAR